MNANLHASHAGDARLDSLLAAVTLNRKGLYWFRHREYRFAQGADCADRALRERIAFTLRDRLYNSYYTQGGPKLATRANPPPQPDLDFAKSIASCVRDLGATSRTMLRYSPGFMMIRGGAPGSSAVPAQVRLYWHIASWDAADFARVLTAILDRTGIGYSLKILNNAELYSRADSAVLYLSRENYARIGVDLERAYHAFFRCLRGDVPALTKRLGRGVGVAESPDDAGTSYGLHRCTLLAEGFVRGWDFSHDDWQKRRRAVDIVFAEHGLDTTKPFLAPGGVDVFPTFDPPRSPPHVRRRSTEDLPLLVRMLRESAIWHGDVCTWWHFRRAESARRRGQVSSPVGPDVYGGNAGISLLLAEYSNRRSCDEARRMATGACKSVLVDLASGALADAQGLHVGPLGALLIAGIVARKLCLDRELRQIGRMARAFARQAKKKDIGRLDLLAGVAGDAFALSMLGRLLANTDLVKTATAMGRHLVRATVWTEGTASWPSPDAPCTANLTGMSHGAAGIACALMALYAETGEEEFRQVALAGFRYERAKFDHELRNWPDFRMIYRTKRTEMRLRRTNIAWCHGAGGIALARLHALAILDDPELKTDAYCALEIVRAWMRRSINSPDADLCLCHGLAGNAVVLNIAKVTALASPEDEELVRQATVVLEARLATLHDAQTIADPGLMTGVSGVGWFLLTWKDPLALPVPFLPEPPRLPQL